MTLFTMLAHPNRFFNEFHKLPPKWLVAYIGYYLVAFEVILNGLVTDEKMAELEISLSGIFLISFFTAFIGALLYRLDLGVIWLFLGSKIFGGRALSAELGNAVGYILLPFGIVGLVAVPAALIPAWIGDETTIAIASLCVTLPVLLLINLAMLVYSAFAVRQLNGFGWWKTLGVMAWYPLLLTLLGVILVIIAMLAA